MADPRFKTLPIMDKNGRIQKRRLKRENVKKYIYQKAPVKGPKGFRTRVFYIPREDTIIVRQEALDAARGRKGASGLWTVTLRGHYDQRPGKDRRAMDWSITAVIAGCHEAAKRTEDALWAFYEKNAGSLVSEASPVSGIEKTGTSVGLAVESVRIIVNDRGYEGPAEQLRAEIEEAIKDACTTTRIDPEAVKRLTAKKTPWGFRAKNGQFSKGPNSVVVF